MKSEERGSGITVSRLYTHGFVFANLEINDSTSSRNTCKGKLHWLSGEELPGLVSCGDAETSAFELL